MCACAKNICLCMHMHLYVFGISNRCDKVALIIQVDVCMFVPLALSNSVATSKSNYYDFRTPNQLFSMALCGSLLQCVFYMPQASHAQLFY